MNIENFKTYISNRPFITENYDDEMLVKALNFSKNILTLFYDIPSEELDNSDFEFPLFEQAIYILQNDPTSEFITKYEGLAQFNVAGAISASVLQEYLPYLSKLSRRFLEKAGYACLVSDNSKISYGYTFY